MSRMRRGSSSIQLLRVMLLVVMLLLSAAAMYLVHHLKQVDRTCLGNLHSIYGALDRYESDRGLLPELAFFPDDPFESPDSLLTVLRRYGVTDMHCTCPALPKQVKRFGMTYVWNTALNGRQLSSIGEPVWMMVEVSVLNPVLPAPHNGDYHVLYSDGGVQIQDRPPPGL